MLNPPGVPDSPSAAEQTTCQWWALVVLARDRAATPGTLNP